MTRYRKKPVEIEAVQFTGDNVEEIKKWMYPHVQQVGNPSVWFHTLEAPREDGVVAEAWDLLHATWVGVKKDQWIIKGIQGEFYPCAPDIFEATYEKVDE